MQRLAPSRFSLAAFAASLLFATLAHHAPVWGQRPGAGGLPAGAASGGNAILEVTGTYEGAIGRMMKIKRDDDTEVFVQLPTDPSKISFHAEADPQMINPGLTVRFETEIGPNGLPTAPVETVEIIRPISGPGMSRAAKEKLTPGVYPLNKPPAGQPARFLPGPYRVVGRLMGAAQNMIVVAAGNTPVRAQVADDVKFVIRFNTLELAQPGDQVKVSGFYNPPDETKVRGDTVQISTERVIGEADAKPQRRGRRGRGRANAEAPASEEGKTDAADEGGAEDADEGGEGAAKDDGQLLKGRDDDPFAP